MSVRPFANRRKKRLKAIAGCSSIASTLSLSKILDNPRFKVHSKTLLQKLDHVIPIDTGQRYIAITNSYLLCFTIGIHQPNIGDKVAQNSMIYVLGGSCSHIFALIEDRGEKSKHSFAYVYIILRRIPDLTLDCRYNAMKE